MFFEIFSRLRRFREQRRRRGIYYNIHPLRVLLFGWPVPTEHQEHVRIPKRIALPVFSSDAISSVAYATQQILLALGTASLWTMSHQGLYDKLTLGITAGIVFLLVVVVTSYWQTIFAYPSGGGSYIVSKENLGPSAGLVAGAALLIDYVLTVSVSIAAGVQNILSTPIMARWKDDIVPICIICVVVLTVANLRGLKESGTAFAFPTYWFIAMASLLILTGIFGPSLGWRIFPDAVNQMVPDHIPCELPPITLVALLALILKAFANGCSAMTGVEAVSNGIPAFREPRSRNAAITLVLMALTLGFLFVGISWLSVHLHVVYWERPGTDQTAPPVIDQLAAAIFGKPGGALVTPFRSFLYYSMQFSTMAILVLAANTSFAGFPSLASIMANDRFLPRPLSSLGDKLVFSNGIVLLGFCASMLLVLFHGKVDDLIPLYAVGVFTAFTLSQFGMVVHWWKLRGKSWLMRAIINGVGGSLTLLVLLDITVEKGPEGAWMVVVLGGGLFGIFRIIHGHYLSLSKRLSPVAGGVPQHFFHHIAIILVPSLHRGILKALGYARAISDDCRAVHVATEPANLRDLQLIWEELVGKEIPLIVLDSPYRSLVGPLASYIDQVQIERKELMITVIVPEFVSEKWWHAFLHNNSGLAVKWALLNRPGVVVSNVRYFVDDERDRQFTDANGDWF